MKIDLTRFCSGPFGAFGKLHIQGREFYTVEKPWRDNQPFISCVPLGEYRLIWRPTSTHVPHQFDGHTWYLVGRTVGVEKGEKLRWGCAIHVGNFDENVQGCIAPGSSLGYAKHEKSDTYRWSVSRSGDTMLDLLQLLGPQDHELSINNTLMG